MQSLHLQAAQGFIATMALPALPASPTLTNPDMILPYGDEYESGPLSPQDPFEENVKFSIGPALVSVSPATPIIYGNGTMLSDIGEVTEAESTPRRLPGPAERRALKQAQNGMPIRSSPTVGYEAVMKRTKLGSHQRSVSAETTSTVTTEGQAAELFKDFDDGVSVDDSVFQGDDEESVADSYSHELVAQETERLANAESVREAEEDRLSSAALSRRAEQILLNAKKRLNNMEGNLSRARSSLFITSSSSLSTINSSSPLSRSPSSPSMHRRLNGASDSPAGSPGHSRVYSENSISPNMRTGRFPVRSSSAGAVRIVHGGGETPRRAPSLSQSHDNIREEARNASDARFSSPLTKSSPPEKISPPRASTLEPLTEDEPMADIEADRASIRSTTDGYQTPTGELRSVSRSASSLQVRDLRDQMSDLKGRISVLRDRARDDSMRRRSMQSLRTPSPFTAAEQWYAGAKGYGEGGLSADAGVAQPPWDGLPQDETKIAAESGEHGDRSQVPDHQYQDSDVTSVYEDVSEQRATNLRARPEERKSPREEHEKENQQERDELVEDDYNDEIVYREEADDYESDASSYHDTVTHPISHEDREDAFDYEHFFLHSAMGTISQQRMARRERGGSFSSEDSVETTRGPVTQSRTGLYHTRTGSNTSVSTIASFATATEGRRTKHEDRNSYAVQEVSPPERRTSTPLTAKRETFGLSSPSKNRDTTKRQASQDREQAKSPALVSHDDKEQWTNLKHHRPSISSMESSNSHGSSGSTRSFPLVNKPKLRQTFTPPTSNTNSMLRGSMDFIDRHGTGNGESPVHMLAREDQILVERLVASVGKCVLGLHEAGQASYEGRVFRRRLDAARRVLEGLEGAV